VVKTIELHLNRILNCLRFDFLAYEAAEIVQASQSLGCVFIHPCRLGFNLVPMPLARILIN